MPERICFVRANKALEPVSGDQTLRLNIGGIDEIDAIGFRRRKLDHLFWRLPKSVR